MKLFCLFLLLASIQPLHSQVWFDTAGVPTLREIKRWDIPTGIRRNINAVNSFCGVSGNDVLVSRIHDVSPQTWSQSAPFDTSNVYSWSNGPETSTALEIDHDGVAPLEYITENGEIFRCRSESNLPEERVDMLPCAVFVSSENKYRCDVDSNGSGDIIIDPKNSSSNYADVILSGAEYGMGCNRVMSLPRKPGNNGLVHTTTWVRFYRDFDGQLRMLINSFAAGKGIEGVYLYRVSVKWESNQWNIAYEVTDSVVREIDRELAPNAIYAECIVKDTTQHHHYTVQSWTRGYRYGKDVLNEPVVSVYLIDGGRLVETEAVVGVIDNVYSHDNDSDEGPPIISYSWDAGLKFMSRITGVAHPIAKFQWGLSAPYRTFINDQNDDGRRDFLIATDHLPGQLRLYDMNTTPTDVIHEEHADDWVSFHNNRLLLNTLQTCLLTYRIIDLAGKIVESVSVPIDGHSSTIDLSPKVMQLTAGQYLVAVTCGTRQKSFTILK